MLNMASERTTDRQERIPGFMQDILHGAKILVIGAGATGNEVLKNLALTGFAYVCVLDMDYISTSNLSRTVLFTKNDVGKMKAETAAARFVEMNIADGAADYINCDICTSLGEGLVRCFDIIINCVDNDQTRLFMSELSQRLGVPFIDLAIGSFSWNVFTSSGKIDDPCFACTMSSKDEASSLDRVRNSCDVTRIIAASTGKTPTIAVSSSIAGGKAVEQAIKMLHHMKMPNSTLPVPRYGVMEIYNGNTGITSYVKFKKRHDCHHHVSYSSIGGVIESKFSAHHKLREILEWVAITYGEGFHLSLYKDCSCIDRAFVTTARCVHCGESIEVYTPQSKLHDTDMRCEVCKSKNLMPRYLSEGILKTSFNLHDDERILNLSLLQLGIPLAHIVMFENENDEKSPLIIELTQDVRALLPHLPE